MPHRMEDGTAHRTPKSQVTPPTLSSKVWKEHLRAACRQNRLRRRSKEKANAVPKTVPWNDILREELQQQDIAVFPNHHAAESPMILCSPDVMRMTPSSTDASMDAIPMSLDVEEDSAAADVSGTNHRQHCYITEDELYQLLLELEQDDVEDWEPHYEAWELAEAAALQEQIHDYELWQDAKD
jgi:hypothetical protein